jgi:hypothetical protein
LHTLQVGEHELIEALDVAVLGAEVSSLLEELYLQYHLAVSFGGIRRMYAIQQQAVGAGEI